MWEGDGKNRGNACQLPGKTHTPPEEVTHEIGDHAVTTEGKLAYGKAEVKNTLRRGGGEQHNAETFIAYTVQEQRPESAKLARAIG